VENVSTPEALGSFDNDDFINSNNPEYVMGEIRRRHLLNSSVTILLVGKCTHSRRYVDGEPKSSLRRGANVPNGLVAFVLPSAMPPAFGLFGPIEWHQRAWPVIPDRLTANWDFNQQDNCYARYFVMPTSAEELRGHIEAAVGNRTHRAHLIQNDAIMMKNNAVSAPLRTNSSSPLPQQLREPSKPDRFRFGRQGAAPHRNRRPNCFSGFKSARAKWNPFSIVGAELRFISMAHNSPPGKERTRPISEPARRAIKACLGADWSKL
jgi:hypothetical protein